MKILRSLTILGVLFGFGRIGGIADGSEAPAPVLAPFTWMLGDWKCQLDQTTWGPLHVHPARGGRTIAISWDYADNGKGDEVIAYDATRHRATLTGEETMGPFVRTWALVRDANDAGDFDLTFEGRASERRGDAVPHVYRVREEFIEADDLLAEWRSAAGEHTDDWHGVGSRHCALHGTPNGIEY